VALESVLAESRDVPDVPHLAGDIHITWRDVTGRSISARSRDRLRRAAVANNPAFFHRGGARDLTVLLTLTPTGWQTRVGTSPTPYETWLETMDPPPTADIGTTGRGADDLDATVRAEVAYRRAQVRLRLQRLSDLRNEIVHEAAVYATHHDVLVDALGEAVMDVLGKICDAMASKGATTLAEVQRDLDTPWM
jgi:hypothetical protein